MQLNLRRQHSVLQKPNRASPAAMEVFHTHEYIDFLQSAKPDHITEAQVQHYNVIDDSPVFDGVFKFCQIYAGASIHGAQKLIQEDYDIAINWAGGLHHAKKSQASGVQPSSLFAYIAGVLPSAQGRKERKVYAFQQSHWGPPAAAAQSHT